MGMGDTNAAAGLTPVACRRYSAGRSPMPRQSAIPVIDLFAGPGGLGEGFASLSRTGLASPRGLAFESCLSIEKDPLAHRTLELRAFFRQFDPGKAPADYYRYLRREITRDELSVLRTRL